MARELAPSELKFETADFELGMLPRLASNAFADSGAEWSASVAAGLKEYHEPRQGYWLWRKRYPSGVARASAAGIDKASHLFAGRRRE